jgi:hypothetical protein
MVIWQELQIVAKEEEGEATQFGKGRGPKEQRGRTAQNNEAQRKEHQNRMEGPPEPSYSRSRIRASNGK